MNLRDDFFIPGITISLSWGVSPVLQSSSQFSALVDPIGRYVLGWLNGPAIMAVRGRVVVALIDPLINTFNGCFPELVAVAGGLFSVIAVLNLIKKVEN